MASIERPNDPASRAFRRFREHGDPAAMTEVFDLIGQELFALAAHIARDAAEADAPLAKALTGEVRLAIKCALEGVPARYREVLRPVLEDGVAPTTLAATLGRAPGTVRAQLHRDLELLRKALPHTLAPALERRYEARAISTTSVSGGDCPGSVPQ